MAKMTVKQLIDRLPHEHQKDIRAKAKKINVARAKTKHERCKSKAPPGAPGAHA